MARASERAGLAPHGIVAAMGLLFASVAEAQPAPAERALAEQLFHEGRALLDGGRVAEACAKLEESQRLDPGGGTLMNVARCHKEQGRTASAWAEYAEARDQAVREGRATRVEEAEEQIRALVPLLSRLTITLSPEVAALPGLIVQRNGVALGTSALTRMIVDPGPYDVEVTAPGHEAFRATVEVGGAGDVRAVEVPALAVARAEAEAGDARDEALAIAGLTVGAIGLGALAAGTVAGVMALVRQSSADARCPEVTCTDAEGVQDSYDAQTAATIANITLPIGAAATIVGAVLLYALPDAGDAPTAASTPSAWALPSVGPGFVGVDVAGTF